MGFIWSVRMGGRGRLSIRTIIICWEPLSSGRVMWLVVGCSSVSRGIASCLEKIGRFLRSRFSSKMQIGFILVSCFTMKMTKYLSYLYTEIWTAYWSDLIKYNLLNFFWFLTWLIIDYKRCYYFFNSYQNS